MKHTQTILSPDIQLFDPQTQIWIRPEHKTSYSARHTYRTCPRKYQISRYPVYIADSRESTIDTAFGHFVGTAVQQLIMGKSLQQSLFVAFCAWDMDLWEEKAYSKKSLIYAIHAVEKFYTEGLPEIGAEWEIYITPDGRPAAELGFGIDSEFGYMEIGFIDLAVKHRTTGTLAVIEIKTSGDRVPHEASWGESDQALGYSAVLDVLAHYEDLPSAIPVYYLVYYSTLSLWRVYPFEKSLERRLEFAQGLLQFWKTLELNESFSPVYPRSGNCISYSKPCEFYGSCGSDISTLIKAVNIHAIARPQVVVTLAQIVLAIENKMKASV